MPTSLSPVGISNISLCYIGAQPINSLTDQSNPSALVCNQNLVLAYLEVSRAARWNCLLTTAVLTEIPQTPIPGLTPIGTPADWAPLTSYLENVYLSYGGYIYITMFAYTSTNNFLNDLTTGALTQTNVPSTGRSFGAGCGSQFPSGWGFQFALPDDFQLMAALNDNVGWWGWSGCADGSDEYEIMGTSLFCDASKAVIQYVKSQPDTTQFDSLFTGALAFKLASMMATPLRQDGGVMAAALLAQYTKALKEARTKNGGEKLSRRFNPIQSSRFLQARRGGVNG